MRVRRFVNYSKLCVFVSQIAHDYESHGIEYVKERHGHRRGIYKRYLDGYVEYRMNERLGIKVEPVGYDGGLRIKL